MKMFFYLNPRFDKFLHTCMYVCQHCLTTSGSLACVTAIFFIDSQAGYGQFLKKLITLEPHGTCIFKSFLRAYLY